MKNKKDERPAIQIGTALYRKYSYRSYKVTGETSRSWLVRSDDMAVWESSYKVPKCKLPDGWILDAVEWENWCFASKYRGYIKNAVEYCAPAQLRAISELLNWTPPEEKKL